MNSTKKGFMIILLLRASVVYLDPYY